MGRMGAAYYISVTLELSAASYTRAYQFRDRLTEKGPVEHRNRLLRPRDRRLGERIFFRASFFKNISSGCVRSCQPQRLHLCHLGQPDRAADEAAETARLQPSAYYFGSAIQSIRFASRFNEAKSWLAKADALKFDNSLIRRERLIVAFATGDHDNVEKILKQEEARQLSRRHLA